MHHYTKNAQGEWIHGQPKQELTTVDKALMAVGVLLVIVGAVMGVL
ncbi:hypothetical protein [Vibrio phage H188]|nr:hypothetical protein [Vibrio phage H188]